MDDIRGLKPFYIFAPNWKLILLAVIVVLAVVALIAWWRKRPRPVAAPAGPAPVPMPHRALTTKEQLDHLRSNRLIEAGRVREFHGSLSAILRGFLGQRFDLPGRRLTSTEILANLEGKTLDRAAFQAIAELLTACDMVKFAKDTPTAIEMQGRLTAAYHLVESLGDTRTPLEDADDTFPEPDRASAGS